jgi:lipid-A-disaccharide synthase
VARTLDPAFVEGLIKTRQATSLQQHRGVPRASMQRGGIHLVPEALPALFHARAAIVASGTATVEAAIMGTPFIMVYRVSPLTYALGKPRVKVAHFAMVNLIAGEEVVPELVQNKFTADNIVAELKKIIPDGQPRTDMITKLARVKASLKHESGQTPAAERAAEIILEAVS